MKKKIANHGKAKLSKAEFGRRGYDSKGPKIFKASGGAIIDSRGQWAHPGQVTIIPGNEITMQGVPYPVMGISDTGHKQLMKPGKNYTFAGNSVTEYPMQNGGILNNVQTMRTKNNNLPEAKDGKWIQKAVNPKHKGYCTPMTKSTCTPRRKALARTFKKHHGFHKENGGEVLLAPQGSVSDIAGNTTPCFECGGTMDNGGSIGKAQIAGGFMDAGGKIMWNTPKFGWGQNGAYVNGGSPYQDGGQTQGGGQDQQLMQMVAQALQQGQQPQQVLQTLVKQGVPQDQASQIIQQVEQQLQGQQSQQSGGEQEPPQAKTGMRMKTPIKGQEQGDPNAQIEKLAQGVAQNDVKAIQIVKTLPPAAQQQVMQLVQQMQQPQGQGDQGQNSQDQPPMAQLGVGLGQSPYQTPYNPNLGYYGNIAGYYGNQAGQYGQQSKADFAKADDIVNMDPNDPNYDAEQQKVEGLRNQGVQANKQKSAANFTSGAAGFADVMHTTSNVLGGVSSLIASNRARLSDEQERLYGDRNNRAVVAPFHGDEQTGTSPAYKRYGGKTFARNGTSVGEGYIAPMLPIQFQSGGQLPTEGTDFQSNNPNVVTERGETITDPTRGPIGPDGNPTGAVVHDQTGDQHSDPSGGNAYKLGPDSVVHSKVLGVKVGDFLKYAGKFPNGDKIIATVTDKFKDPDKEVSFAKIASLFDTKKLMEEVDKIGKDTEKNEDHGKDPNSTPPTQMTTKLNRKTLANKLETTKQQIQENTQVAGANGPIHAMSETLKGVGAYGSKIQQEQQEQSANPQAKNGKVISMKGKKVRLPIAQSGYTVPNPNDKSQQRPVINATVNTPAVNPVQTTSIVSNNPRVLSNYPIQPKYPEKTETGFEYGAPDQYNWLNWQRGLDNSASSRGFQVPMLNQAEALKYKGEADPQLRVNKAYQEQSYDDALDTPSGRRALANMWEEAGKTSAGKNLGIPVQGLSNLNDTDLKEVLSKLRPNYIDGNLDYRKSGYITPQTQSQATNTSNPAQPADLSGINANAQGASYPGKIIYQEGLHPGEYVGDMAALLSPRRPVPYIEDKGAADALAATTRQRFVNPYTGDVQRALLAKTWNNSNDPVNRARMAQDKANSYEESNKRFSEADRENAGIEQRYNDTQNRLREAAGKNKAEALNTLAKRTADVEAATEKQRINALTDYGYKQAERHKDNTASAIYQQMFQNVALGPNGQLTSVVGGKDVLTPGRVRDMSNQAVSAKIKEELAFAEEAEKKGDYYQQSAHLKNLQILGYTPKMTTKRLGGRVSSNMLKKKK